MNGLFLTLLGALSGVTEAPVARARATPRVEAQVAVSADAGTRPWMAGRGENAWRYVFHRGRWWYWSASERWSYFDGARWVNLDSLHQPLSDRGHLLEVVPRPSTTWSGGNALRFRFGELPAPRSRVGSFELEGDNRVTGRNFAGSFEAGAASPHAVISPPGEPAAAAPNPYGPDSAYGPYGSTDPFRAGRHTGSGGNYGYGLGTPRPVGGYGRPGPHARVP
jgi:hypothetical protein